MRLTSATLFGVLLGLNGCALFDSRVEWSHGRFALLWIDDPKEVRLSYDMGNGGWSELVDSQVFSVGADTRYVVAKQHPKGDKRVTNYFIIDAKNVLKGDSVSGPLTADEFEKKSKANGLPGFSKVLKSLE